MNPDWLVLYSGKGLLQAINTTQAFYLASVAFLREPPNTTDPLLDMTVVLAIYQNGLH